MFQGSHALCSDAHCATLVPSIDTSNCRLCVVLTVCVTSPLSLSMRSFTMSLLVYWLVLTRPTNLIPKCLHTAFLPSAPSQLALICCVSFRRSSSMFQGRKKGSYT